MKTADGPMVSRARRRLIATVLVCGLAGLSALSSWRETHFFLINTTQSLPNWAFLVDRRAVPSRGSLIFFAAPDSALVRRHFGARPAPFGKRVYGVAGDRVSRRADWFLINGRPIVQAKPVSLLGEPLVPGPTGVIPPHCFFVASSHRDGFDSRYAAIGWICRERVLGVGRAVL